MRFACLSLSLAALLTGSIGYAVLAQNGPFAPQNEGLQLGAFEPSMTSSLVPAGDKAAANLQPGDEVVLSFTANVPPGWITYSLKKDMFTKTIIKVEAAAGLEPVDAAFTPDRKPKTKRDPDLELDLEYYKNRVTFSRKYRLTGPVANVKASGLVKWNVCNDDECRAQRHPFELRPANKKKALSVRPR